MTEGEADKGKQLCFPKHSPSPKEKKKGTKPLSLWNYLLCEPGVRKDEKNLDSSSWAEKAASMSSPALPEK